MSSYPNKQKWLHGAIPALFIHCSIGTVYCWSLFSKEMADYMGNTKSEVEWAFSLAIFFLGMSAAFLGSFVENNVKKSAFTSCAFFITGLFGTALCVYLKSLIGVYIFYGVIMGIGLGIGYLTPIKTLMLWFKNHKGLATGISVAGFGAAKAIASPLLHALLDAFPDTPYIIFVFMGCCYLVTMILGGLLIRKPVAEKPMHPNLKEFFCNLGVLIKTYFTNKTFVGIWIIFYLNITCGLALISQEKLLLNSVGITAVGLIAAITAIANALGRIGWSSLGDYCKQRNTIYKWIFVSSIAALALSCVWIGAIPVIILLIVINAGYGGGFSNCPTILAERFGLSKVSAIHGLCLSAWGFAGLSGNQLATAILVNTGSLDLLFTIVGAAYLLSLIICFVVIRNKTS